MITIAFMTLIGTFLILLATIIVPVWIYILGHKHLEDDTNTEV